MSSGGRYGPAQLLTSAQTSRVRLHSVTHHDPSALLQQLRALHAFQHQHVNPLATGKWRKSPVTGRPEMFFPPWQRWLRYGLSVVITAALLLCAFVVMICSLNLQVPPSPTLHPLFETRSLHCAASLSQPRCPVVLIHRTSPFC